jgi:hypothetical protein
MIIITAALVLAATVVLLPRIIEAKRLKAMSQDRSLSVQRLTTRRINQDQDGDVIVGESVRNDTSTALRDMKPTKVGRKVEREANENPKVPTKHKNSADPVVQGANSLMAFAGLNMPSPILNFDGIFFPGVACNCAPPDTNGEVGATQYVQMVNEGFQVFDKTTGASLLGPSGITTLSTTKSTIAGSLPSSPA